MIVTRSPVVAAATAIAVVAGGVLYWMQRRGEPTGAPQAPQEVRRLAMLPFTNAGGAESLEWLRVGLPDMLVTDLSQSRYVRPVPTQRVLRALDEAGLGGQARFDETALASVARQTHAQSVLSGLFVEAGGRLRLDLTLFGSDTSVSIPLELEAPATDVFALVDQMSRQVKAQLDLSPEQLRGDSDRPLAEVSTASLDALKAYQTGLAQMRAGAKQEAAASLEKATAADPKFAMAFAKLAEVKLSLGKDHEAEAAIGKARTLADAGGIPVAEHYQIQAMDALVREDPEAAAKSYAELARLHPDDPDVHMSLARAYQETGRLDESLAAYKRSVELAPGSGAALLGLGEVQVRAEQPDEAIVTLEKALATKQFAAEPEALGTLHTTLGVALRETGRLDDAAQHLGISLQIREKAGDKRGQASTLRNLAQLHNTRGDGKRALDALNKALVLYRELKSDEGESLVLNDLGAIYTERRALDQALAAFKDSFRIEQRRQDPLTMANRLDNIADAYRRKGLYDDALVHLTQAKTALEKTDDKRERGVNLEYLGMVQRAQGLYTQARESFLAALPLYREIENEMSVGFVQMSLADIDASQGRYADAYGALKQALEIFTRRKAEQEVIDARAALGQLLVTLGRPDEAEKEFDETQEHGHGEAPGILMGRARILELRGKHDEAAEAYAKGNVRANLSGEKEIAVRTRIYLGRLYLAQGKSENAARLLARTRDDAAQARLSPLEAEATTVLAQAQVALGQAEAGRRSAEAAIDIAKRLEARPTLARAQAALGAALGRLGKQDEAAAAQAGARAQLEAIRKDLPPGGEDAFLRLPEMRAVAAPPAAR